MIRPLFNNSTKSITGKLALFFILVSLVNCLIIFLVFFKTLQWAEDEMGHKQILVYSQIALHRYLDGESGRIKVNTLTTAYDNLNLLPQEYLVELNRDQSFWCKLIDLFANRHRKDSLIPSEFKGLSHGALIFLGRVGRDSARILYVNKFNKDGITKSLILLSKINEIELNTYELGLLFAFVSVIFLILLMLFTWLLIRLTKKLISPINDLSSQLDDYKGEPKAVFAINNEAAKEFTHLTGQLNQYREEINALIKREQIFGRYASHELRTPLTIVKGANTLLTNTNNDEFQSRQLVRINTATTQMTTMIDALLALVRYERDGNKVELREISQTELNTIIDDHQPYLANKPLEVKVQITGQPLVKASSAIISMVVGNLLRNAISASDKGEIVITMDEYGITVLDRGSGISESPFNDGHGLGLMLVEDFCQRYDWQFSLQNRDKQGVIAKIKF